jgi:Tol biopolymer transport system component
MEQTTRQRRPTTRRTPPRDRRNRLAPDRARQRKPSLPRAILLLLLPLLALPALAAVVKIERISPPPLDLEISWPGGSPAISADGRFVALESVDGSIYVRDRLSTRTELASVSAAGARVQGQTPAISGEGRYVAFLSQADNVVPGDKNGLMDLFVRDREIGKTELVSVTPEGLPANADAIWPAISADGRFIAFWSQADNLVPGDMPETLDLFVRDRENGKTERVNAVVGDFYPGLGPPAISGDGRFVAFPSRADHLAPGDDNDTWDIFVRDRQTGRTERVSIGVGGEAANSASVSPAISADGRFVAFVSHANNLVPDDRDGVAGVFVRDRQAGTSQFVGVAQGFLTSFGGTLFPPPVISADGRAIAFLTPGSTKEQTEIAVWDRQSGRVERASVAADGGAADGSSSSPAISADGNFIAFQSAAGNLVPDDTNGSPDVFVRDRAAATTTLLSASFNVGRSPLESREPAISGDGRSVAYATGGQIFLRDRVTGVASIVSAAPGGSPGNGSSASPAVNSDGRFVVFWSSASNLVSGGTSRVGNVFVWDRVSRETDLVTVAMDGGAANGWSYPSAISADGRFVGFQSDARNLVPGDTNNTTDVFVLDRQTGKTELISVSASGTGANGPSYARLDMSADGRFATFESRAGNLVPGDTNNADDIFVRDRQAGKTELISVGIDGAPANRGAYFPSISADGRFVVFQSDSTNLTSGGASNAHQVFLRDRQTSTTELISVSTSGAPAIGHSLQPAISANGRFVAFESFAENLVPGDTNRAADIFVRDRQAGTTERISVSTVGAQANGVSRVPSISADGRFVAFSSEADNLVPGDTNSRTDVFVAERE